MINDGFAPTLTSHHLKYPTKNIPLIFIILFLFRNNCFESRYFLFVSYDFTRFLLPSAFHEIKDFSNSSTLFLSLFSLSHFRIGSRYRRNRQCMCVSPLVYRMIYYFYLATVPRLDYHQRGDVERCPERGRIVSSDEIQNYPPIFFPLFNA